MIDTGRESNSKSSLSPESDDKQQVTKEKLLGESNIKNMDDVHNEGKQILSKIDVLNKLGNKLKMSFKGERSCDAH